MSIIDHDAATSLLAACALDALSSDEERQALDAHLEQCASCRRQLDQYREAAARLSPEIAPPAGLWNHLAAQLEPSPVVSLESRRRRSPPRVWLGAAAAVIALVVGVGVGQITGDSGDPTMTELAAAARDDSGTTVLTLVAVDGGAAAEAILTRDGTAYLTNQDLPALAAQRSYQLWAFRDGQPVSVALLGDAPTVAAFRPPSRFERLVITDEPAEGSPQPTTVPIASATA